MQNGSLKLQYSSDLKPTKISVNNLDLSMNDSNIKSFFDAFFSVQENINQNKKIQEKDSSAEKNIVQQQKQIQRDKECKKIVSSQKIQNLNFKDLQNQFEIILQQMKKYYSSKSQISHQTNNNSKSNLKNQQTCFQHRKKFYNEILGEYQNMKFQYKIQNKQKYKIEISPFMKSQIEIFKMKNSFDYSLVWYQIYISYFKMTVCLKNVSKSAEFMSQLLGKGSYGSVFKITRNKKQYAIKRIYLKQKYKREQEIIKDCLKQYSIYKIASFLEIGPKLTFTEDFEVILYDDVLEFQMEFCEPSYFQINEDNENIAKKRQKDLKQNLAILHKNKIVHRDIKPGNTLYSKQYKKYVLADFGESHPIKEEPNVQTYTRIRGTPRYIPRYIKQLHQIYPDYQGHFDLYYLDGFSLNITLEQLKQYKHKNNKEKDQKEKQNREKQYKEKYELKKRIRSFQYSKFPQFQKLHFQIRVQGFNKQIQNQMEFIIEKMENQIIKKKIKQKLIKYISQYKNKQLMKFSWSKKCSQIEQYFINKGYQKIAQKMLIQRLEILTRTIKQIDTNQTEIIKIYQNLIKYSIGFDLMKSKDYLSSMKQLIYKQNKRTIQSNLHFQFIYQSLDLLIKVYENSKGVQYEIYNLLAKYKNQFDIWRSIGQYAKPFAINSKLQQAREIYQIAMKIRRIIKLNKNYNQHQYLQAAQMYLNLARIYSTMEQFQKAIVEAKIGLQLLYNRYKQDHKYYQVSGFLYNIIGFNYLMIYKLPESLQYLKNAQKIHRSNYGRSTFISQTINNIGCAYHLQGKFIQALKYQVQSLNIRIESAGQVSLTTSYVIRDLANTQIQKGDLSQSLSHFKKFQDIYKKLKLIACRQILQCKYSMLFIHMKFQNCEQINVLLTEINSISKETRSKICYEKLRAYNLFIKNYQKCKKSFQKSFAKHQKNLEARIKLYLDFLQFNLEINQKKNVVYQQILTQLYNLLAKTNQTTSYLYARYHYLNSRLLFLTNTTESCLESLQKAIELFKSYFEYHYMLIDCYLILLQINVNSNKDVASIIQIQLNLEKIFEHHKYQPNHSKIIKFKQIKEKCE